MALVVKNPHAHAEDIGDTRSVLGSGRAPGGGQDHPTPVFLSGEIHGQRSPAGYSPQGYKESDMTEAAEHTCTHTMMDKTDYQLLRISV